ncbi:MAG: ATP-binding cassette domain-containing protein, partial [Oscillospiraceae bacterium]
GILLENPSFLPNLTGRANLRLLAEMQGHITDTCLDHTLSTVGLDANDPRKYRKYSLGMKQRLGIAAAVLNDPDIIILDEPLNALDTEGVAMVHDIINAGRERGAIILLACHNREELDALADELILIENGQITSPQKSQ